MGPLISTVASPCPCPSKVAPNPHFDTESCARWPHAPCRGNGVEVSSTGQVLASGQLVARGAAIQGGDAGTVINGTVECRSYNASDSGGCVAGGGFLSIGPTGSITGTSAYCSGSAGCVANGGHMLTLEGQVSGDGIYSDDAGAVLSSDNMAMSGDASVVGRNLQADSGAVIATGNLTLGDNCRIVAINTSSTGDGGAIQANWLKIHDNSVVRCDNGYAANCGACILASMEVDGNASIIAHNMTGGELGGALCGGYPGQTLSVSGTVLIDVTGSTSKLYGGAIMAHNISLGPGAFAVRIRNATAQCGAAMATLNWNNSWGDGLVTVDGLDGGTVLVEDVYEGIPGLGCNNIFGHLQGPPMPGPIPWNPTIPQPCSACATPDFPPSRREQCTCEGQPPAPVRECCSP